MDLILKTVLKSIDEEFILNTDGTEQRCESGATVLDAFGSFAAYAIRKIGAKDGKVYIEVCDQTDVIARQNTAWMEEEKEKTGIELSYF